MLAQIQFLFYNLFGFALSFVLFSWVADYIVESDRVCVFLELIYYCDRMSYSFHILIFLQIDEEKYSVVVHFKCYALPTHLESSKM